MIARDRLWVPTITAARRDDALIGLGFSVAEDRLWQMDLLRRAALGQLSEVFGERTLSSDRLMRLIDMPGIVDSCLEATSDDGRRAIACFSHGVNLRIRRGPLPFEFRVLRYRPRPWAPRDSVAVARLLGWVMSAMHESDLIAEELTAVLGQSWADAILLGTTPIDAPPPMDVTRGRRVTARPTGGVMLSASNAWAVAAHRSATGAPILANDPHLACTNPALWYEARVIAPNFTVAGVTIPGLPAIAIGRTPMFAWGFTASMISQSVLYRESLTNDGTSTLETDGPRPLALRHEIIRVRGGPDDRFVVRSTQRGPLLSDLLPQASGAAFSLYWAGMEPGAEIDGLLLLNAAQTVDEGLRARSLVTTPTFNVIAADADGAIEQVTIGTLYARESRPGLLDAALYPPPRLPFEAAPRMRDPRDGVVANSNEQLTAPTGDALHGKWDPPFRVQRVHQLLRMRDVHAPADMLAMQTDCLSLHAQSVVPILVGYLEGHAPAWAVEDLRAWDYLATSESRATLLFEAFYNHWSRTALEHRLPRDLARGVLCSVAGEAQFRFLDRLLSGELSAWLAPATAEECARAAFAAALEWIKSRLGDDISRWTWGRLHTVAYSHPFASARARVSRATTAGPWPVGGTRTTVWMSWWDPDAPFIVRVAPSMRMVADLSHPDRLWVSGTLGQRGTPLARHSRDQAADFLGGLAHPLPASTPRYWRTIEPA